MLARDFCDASGSVRSTVAPHVSVLRPAGHALHVGHDRGGGCAGVRDPICTEVPCPAAAAPGWQVCSCARTGSGFPRLHGQFFFQLPSPSVLFDHGRGLTLAPPHTTCIRVCVLIMRRGSGCVRPTPGGRADTPPPPPRLHRQPLLTLAPSPHPALAHPPRIPSLLAHLLSVAVLLVCARVHGGTIPPAA